MKGSIQTHPSNPYGHLKKATPEEEQAAAERFEREWLVPHGDRVKSFRDPKFETVYVFGCAPSLNQLDPHKLRFKGLVTCNNAHQWCTDNDLLPHVNVFIDSERFINQAPSVPKHVPVAAMFCPAKPREQLQEWFETATSLPFLVPLRGSGQNGRLSNIPVRPLDPSKGIQVMAGSVIYTALQLAALMATKNIVMCGVDMDYGGPTRHWDAQARYVTPGIYDLWERRGKEQMENLRDRLKDELGLTLWKGTTGGKVDVLPQWSWD